ncbi:TPA: 30S ribosomal protein S16 [bacterium]|nr:30S ribosomal protein S16 [bacterium]
MVRIRLKRMGAKKKPHFRIVVAHARSPRDGRVIEELGHYHPVTKEPLAINLSKIDEWIKKGAQMTDTVKKLVTSYRKGGEKDETTS